MENLLKIITVNGESFYTFEILFDMQRAVFKDAKTKDITHRLRPSEIFSIRKA